MQPASTPRAATFIVTMDGDLQNDRATSRTRRAVLQGDLDFVAGGASSARTTCCCASSLAHREPPDPAHDGLQFNDLGCS
jgi:hypothetical protein